jgi:hypothetical protein
MHGLDEWLAGLGGGGAMMALVAALLLGLRHATDPDHLAAVSTLVLSEEGAGARGVAVGEGAAASAAGSRQARGARRAARLGLAWGVGHATTLFALGLPAVLFGRHLPAGVQQGAEVAVGVVIVLLAVRLLLRWRHGHFHSHPHTHGDLRHSHPHFHELAHGEAAEGPRHPEPHGHRHADAMGRTPLAAFGIGLVHGVGGSAAAGVLLVASAPTTPEAVLSLVLFAGGTAISMAAVSGLVGGAIVGQPVADRLERLVPAFGVAGLVFGLWYVVAAVL